MDVVFYHIRIVNKLSFLNSSEACKSFVIGFSGNGIRMLWCLSTEVISICEVHDLLCANQSCNESTELYLQLTKEVFYFYKSIFNNKREFQIPVLKHIKEKSVYRKVLHGILLSLLIHIISSKSYICKRFLFPDFFLLEW